MNKWIAGAALVIGTTLAMTQFETRSAFAAGLNDTDGAIQLAANETAPKKAKKKKHPGKRVYGARGGFGCLACHGRNGAKAIKDYPNVAGQDKKYIENQIKHIMNGKRVSSIDPADGQPRTAGMKGALLTPDGEPRMTKQQIKDVAAWLSSLKPAKIKEPAEPLDPARVAKGAKLYKKSCKSCHGKEGKKPLKGNPYVAGQKIPYLVNQMMDIKNKVRKNGRSKTMVPVIKKFSDDDIKVVAEYLSQVKR
ncbi:MAG: c-type cytochrome [Alphaproteobacteria bacterium]|nr:c-type cytochrome [Rhodospirillales bacterium]MCW9046055.1 c-type cytochrome [Alphaproteobacteria bacterium]